MVEYFCRLILSIIFIVFSLGSLWFIISINFKKIISKSRYKKKKNRKSYQMFLKGTLLALFPLIILFISCSFFVPLVQDLPDVLLHNTKIYEGDCKIKIYSGRGAHQEADFGKHSIPFFDPTSYDGKIQQGNYYCKVEYFPHSELGFSLLLYKSKGGNKVETK